MALFDTPDRVVVTALVPDAGTDGLTEDGVRQKLAAAFKPAVKQAPTRSGEPITCTLSSGARLVMLPDSSVPLVAARVIALSGLGHEPEGRTGTARLVAQTLCSGTAGRRPSDLAEDVERMAALVDATAGRHSLGVRGMFLSTHRERGLDLLLEILRTPRFEPTELERERSLQLEAIRSEADRPASRTMRVFTEAMYAGHPFGTSALGNPTTVSAITRDDLAWMHARDLHPSRLVIAVTGDIDPDAIATRFDHGLGGAGPAPELPTVPAVPTVSGPIERHESGPGEQSHVVVGYPGLTYADPARPALEVLTAVLSGQSGRLFLDLRDRQSLAYSVSCSSMEGPTAGHLLAYIGTAPDKCAQALAGLRDALDTIRTTRITPAELDRARKSLVGQFDVAHERRLARAGTLAVQLAFDSPYRDLRAWADAVLAVTEADVLAVAQRLIDPSREVLAIFDPTGKGK